MAADRMNRVSRFGALVVLALLVGGLLVGGCATRRACGPDPCEPVACAPTTCEPCTTAPDCGEKPPEAKAGEAWCKVWIPGETQVISETVCVSPAQKRCIEIPAKYGTRPKVVCVSEAKLAEKVTPAVWGARKRDVMVAPGRDCWQRVECPPGDLGPCEKQCECWAKTEVPPRYCEVEERVCVSPERRCVQYTPAQYKVVEETFVIEPARCQEVCEPARFETRCREVVQPGRWEWRRNEACEVPEKACVPAPPPQVEELPALQVEMQDSDQAGGAAGVFAVGDVVRYDLIVSSDEGATPLAGLHVVFTLPPELQYMSGGGDGVQVTGSGQAARTGSFDLPLGARKKMYILCRVLAAPATNLVQLTASIQSASGVELALETESTTLKPAAR
jgi:hypothetical protein